MKGICFFSRQATLTIGMIYKKPHSKVGLLIILISLFRKNQVTHSAFCLICVITSLFRIPPYLLRLQLIQRHHIFLYKPHIYLHLRVEL